MNDKYVLEPYDNSLRQILKDGIRKSNRTGTDTISISGMQCHYNISDRFPIPTKRKVWPKAIFAELLWFLSGSTNNKDLQGLGSNVWTPWVSAEFEQKHGFYEGSLGPIYGFQLRHFGGRYYDGNKNHLSYGSGGFDQLQYMVDTLKNDPDSRRILFDLWSPKDLPYMRLPPCHYSFQILVENDGLAGILTQRSGDMFIGVPANIYFYSALTYMFAQQFGYKPKKFVHNITDAHIYVNHIDAANEYLDRPEVDSPRLKLKKAKDIFSYEVSDFEITDYKPLAAIKVDVAV